MKSHRPLCTPTFLLFSASLFVFGCKFQLAAGLVGAHLRKPSVRLRKPSAGGGLNDAFEGPDLIISGIGDSGTRGVKELMETNGMQMCDIVNGAQDNNLTDPGLYEEVKSQLQYLMDAGSHTLSLAAYQKDALIFNNLLDWQTANVAATRQCAMRMSKGMHSFWGFKNPQQLYLWPITDYAYEHRSKMLVVTRDPRDICSGNNQNQFNFYCESLLGRPCKFESKNFPDCYSFWAKVFSDVLNSYVPSGNVKLVRIEDLAIPKPAAARPTAECILEFAGLWEPSHSSSRSPTSLSRQDNVHKALASIHEHSAVYGGNNMTSKRRKELEAQTANHNDALVHSIMLKLGYDPRAIKLIQPEEAAVC